MKNVICIDLTKFNKEKLAEVAELYELNVNNLIENKQNGIANLYVNTNDSIVVAYTTKKDKDTIVYTNIFGEKLKSINPVDLPKKEKFMDVDTILDKIGKYGVESLSVNEKAFLDKSIK